MQVTCPHLEPTEPVPTTPSRAGSRFSAPIAEALAIVCEWSPTPRAVILGGSHASGEAVWAEVEGRALTLSDLDLYVVVSDRREAGAARRRASAARPALERRCLALGIAAPIEAGFHTIDDLARLPARPATLALRRHGRVVRGDPAVLDRIPSYEALDVEAEEVALLLENRGCELLAAWPLLGAPDRLGRLRGRHAVLKCALDLATTVALADGAFPDGAAARVAWARDSSASRAGIVAACAGLWDVALAFRAGGAAPLDPQAAREEWRAAAVAWGLTWRERFAASARAGDPDGWVLDVARRAPLRRRFRQALTFHARGGDGPSLATRLVHALRGTPQHRVHASAALLLAAAASAPATAAIPPLAPGAARTLKRLGVVPARDCCDWERARGAVVRAWDRWLLDGQRTAEPS